MNPPPDPHSFFQLPIWPRSTFRKPRKTRRNSSSSSSSSSSSAQSTSTSPESSSEQPAPPDPFHRPPLSRRGRHRQHQDALLSSHGLVAAPRAPYTLRSQHVCVLTTLLHRCLLDHDFARARRAFGLLMRGKDVDLRRGVWGVGLDILLRTGNGAVGEAKEYLERLALFFPFRSRHHAGHEWLVEVQEKKGKGRQTEDGDDEGEKAPPPPYTSALEFQPALMGLLIEAAEKSMVEKREFEADPPRKIRDRLEQLMLTPPWSDLLVFKMLKGMVCLWLADLEGEEEGEDVNMNRPERRAGLGREARECFEAVQAKGGYLPDAILWFLRTDGDGDEEIADDGDDEEET